MPGEANTSKPQGAIENLRGTIQERNVGGEQIEQGICIPNTDIVSEAGSHRTAPSGAAVPRGIARKRVNWADIVKGKSPNRVSMPEEMTSRI